MHTMDTCRSSGIQFNVYQYDIQTQALVQKTA